MIRLKVSGLKSDKLPDLARLLSEYTDVTGTISARVVPSEEVAELNRSYAGRPEPTDVLSFNYREGGIVSSELGDVVISREHIARQAAAAGTDEETEAILLLLHGCLHILGYDHADVSTRDHMDRIQGETMQTLGLTYRNFGWQLPDVVT